MRLAAGHVFSSWPLTRIQADCDLDNVASFRSLTKAGLRYEGVIAVAPSPDDAGAVKERHLFSLTANGL
jgi:RimJ/RimL family protein N-acetyltransferase